MNAQTIDPAVVHQVNELLAQMTLKEKVGQMTQIDFSVIGYPIMTPEADTIDPAKLEEAILKYHVGSILNTPTTPANKAQSITHWHSILEQIDAVVKQSRLKIPVIYGIDAIHGATYTQNSTLFPQAISMAATFNPELSFQSGEITAREVRVSGLHWNFAPVMDMGRQPLWPRVWETYGEDVHLASVMGCAYIKGHQGDDFSARDKAPTCLKHYLGYSFPFNGKDRTPAYLGERTLREFFLPSFAAGIKAGAPTIMINSSEVDGIPGHANYQYLTTILRDELGFKGFTVSDWEDIKRLYTRDKLAASEQEAVKIAVMAGVDMSMVPFDYSFAELLLRLVESGEVPMSRIDEAVGRILTVKFQSGLFDQTRVALPTEKHFATAEATAVNRQAAREAIILAKNNQLLPLPKQTRILVTGPTANLLNVLNGGWTITWQGNAEELYPQDKLTVLAAIKQTSLGTVGYVGGQHFTDSIDLAKLSEAAQHHEVIILCLGEAPYTETPGNIDSLNLEPAQLELAEAALATGKPVVLLMLGGRPRIITSIADRAAAVLLGFLPGMEGGMAIADILYGDYNPDGKLPISYPRSAGDRVLYDHKPMEHFEMNSYDPLYRFGHGLSYSQFTTTDLALNKQRITQQESITVTVIVKNTGLHKGKETVLVYLNDVVASVTRPTKQLKAFKKIELDAGEAQKLHFTLTPDDYSFIGVDLKRIIEPGEFRIMVGDEQVTFFITH